MMKIILLILLSSISFAQKGEMSVKEIISEIDKNMNAKSRVLTSKMIVHGRRSSRTIKSKNWVVGIDKAFTEYISPPREAGTKMLKREEFKGKIEFENVCFNYPSNPDLKVLKNLNVTFEAG